MLKEENGEKECQNQQVRTVVAYQVKNNWNLHINRSTMVAFCEFHKVIPM